MAVSHIILTWMNYDNSNRKKYFAQLFRQVRLAYVARDFVHNNIETNDLVKKWRRLFESCGRHVEADCV